MRTADTPAALPPSLRYGLAGGCGALVLTLAPCALLRSGAATHRLAETAGYLSMLAGVLAVYFASRRRAASPGEHAARDLFGLGAAVSAVAGVVLATGAWFAFEFLLPDALPRLLEAYELDLRARSLPPGELADALARLESGRRRFVDPLFQAVVPGFTLFVVGLIASLYAAFRFRTPGASRAQ